MTPFRNDDTNPFARPTPWPGIPQTPMRLSVPLKVAPPAVRLAPEPEAEPQAATAPVPRLLVVDRPVLDFSRPAPQPAAAPAVTPTADANPQPPPAPTVSELIATIEIAPRAIEGPPQPAAAPIVSPIGRAAPARPRPAARRMALAPVVGGAVAAAVGVAALFVLMGQQAAPKPAAAAAPGLAVGQLLTPAAAAPAPASASATEPGAVAPPAA
ncbi:MAG: hypothetical protein ACJ798_20175, partial [Phenylobacterium sp.]